MKPQPHNGKAEKKLKPRGWGSFSAETKAAVRQKISAARQAREAMIREALERLKSEPQQGT